MTASPKLLDDRSDAERRQLIRRDDALSLPSGLSEQVGELQRPQAEDFIADDLSGRAHTTFYGAPFAPLQAHLRVVTTDRVADYTDRMKVKQSATALVGRREALGHTQQSLADAVGMSLRQYQRYEGGQDISMKAARKLAAELGCSPHDIMFGEMPIGGFQAQSKGPSVAVARDPTPIIPGSELVGGKNFPIYSLAQGGPDGSTILSFEALEYARRPEPLMNEPGGFGMYIEGDSMEPAYRAGDIALVDPRRPPRRDDDVLLIASDDLGGEQRAMIKRLIGQTPTHWRVQQFNPPETFDLPKAEWKQALWVVGSYKRR